MHLRAIQAGNGLPTCCISSGPDHLGKCCGCVRWVNHQALESCGFVGSMVNLEKAATYLSHGSLG